MEKITFFIPSYKNTDKLERAIESILIQDCSDMIAEIIVSEDISENHSMIETIVKRFGDSRIRYIVNNPRLGMTGNWNRAFEMSKTRYVALLHDDDYLLETYSESLREILESGLNFDVMFFSNVVEVDGKRQNETANWMKKVYATCKYKKIKKINSKDYYFGGIQGVTVPTCGALYNKEFMQKCGGGYSAEDGYSTDEIFVERFCSYGNIYFYNRTSAVYTYTSSGNLSSQHEVKQAFAMESFQHHMEMTNWWAKLLNRWLREGIYYSRFYPWEKELFPEYIVTFEAALQRKIFEVICRVYIYKEGLTGYRKLERF